MTILSPIWLLLIIPLAAAHYFWPLPTRLLNVMRWALLILLLLGMAGLAVRLPSRSGTVVVVADRSRSMPSNATQQQLEAIERIHAERSPTDKLAVVSFGQQTTVEHPPQDAAFGGFNAQVGQDASSLNDALDRAIGLIGPDSPGRIILLSDGRWTGTDPQDAAATAATRGIPIDYRLLQRAEAGDLAVDSIELPDIGYPAEAFLIGAWVRSPSGQEINYQLRRGNTVIASGSRQVPPGLSRLIFRDAVNQPTTAQYTLTVEAADGSTDPIPENNRARALLGIDGPRPILLVTEKPNPLFAQLLQAGGLSVQTRTPSSIPWSLETLSAYSSVILEEVPADRIGNTGLQLIGDWVASAGTGLMMTGGKHSYGTGNYFHSPMEEILPVSMEMRQEHRKHRVAIVVALDRSGSMSVPVAGGKTKMDLADLAAAEVLNMLTPGMDELGVLAVDSQAHLIANLQTIPSNTGALRNRILSIESMGGGIFVFEALSQAANMLQRSSAGARHIILFADAADAEQPGQYRELLAQCRAAGITCSVIGLGTERDVDAEFLKDIARRGDGRVFFTEDPNKLPQLFQQDTFVVARTSFVEEPTPFQTTPALHTIAGQSFNNPAPPPVGGYNLTYLKEGATLAAVTNDADGYNAPVIASWQYHAGRVLAYTAQTDGQFTGPIANWPQVGSMLTSLARWTAGESTNLPNNMVLTQTVNNGITPSRHRHARSTRHPAPNHRSPAHVVRPRFPLASGPTQRRGNSPLQRRHRRHRHRLSPASHTPILTRVQTRSRQPRRTHTQPPRSRHQRPAAHQPRRHLDPTPTQAPPHQPLALAALRRRPHPPARSIRATHRHPLNRPIQTLKRRRTTNPARRRFIRSRAARHQTQAHHPQPIPQNKNRYARSEPRTHTSQAIRTTSG